MGRANGLSGIFVLMQQRQLQERRWLWSDLLAFWCDRTRRRALPLLLATLFLWMPTSPASAACTCEAEHSHPASQAMSCEEVETHLCEADQVAPHPHSEIFAVAAVAPQPAPLTAALSSPLALCPTPICCSCPSGASAVSVVAGVARVQSPLDSQLLIFALKNPAPVPRKSGLSGWFGRAGPPFHSKPKTLFLASLSGRAPPVSL